MEFIIEGVDRTFDSLVSARAYIMRMPSTWSRLNITTEKRVVGYVKRINGRVYWFGNEGRKWVHRDGGFVSREYESY